MHSRIDVRKLSKAGAAGGAPRPALRYDRARTALLHPGLTGRRPQRWAVAASWTAFVCTLPSAAWRVAMLAGADLGFAEAGLFRDSTGGRLYVLGLEVVQVGAAALCLGLCMRWGERIPPAVPLLGGARIHRLVPTVLGGLGAVALTWIIATLVVQFMGRWLGLTDVWTPADGMDVGQRVLLALAYAPALLWPFALVLALIGYWRRRSPH